MPNETEAFDVFVEKIVIHNKLVSAERLKQAKSYIDQNPEISLLNFLVQTELVKQAHAEQINSKFVSIQKNQQKNLSPSPDQVDEKFGMPVASEISSDEDWEKMADSAGEEDGTGSIRGDMIFEMLAKTRSLEASDLHLSVDSPPMIRKYGRFQAMDKQPLSDRIIEKLIDPILNRDTRKQLEEKKVIDFCLDVPDQGRYRTCIVRQRCGWDASFRIIRSEIPTFEELGLPESLKRLTEYQQGLVLVTGPTGMGKSTTLAAMIDLINRNRREHIITLEDPIEYVFQSDKSHISQREIGSHTQSYTAALRAALREDPDVIMVGELRDFETASLAITAAETGHLVFTTLHTTNAAQTIHRLLDMFPPKQQQQIRVMVSESIRGVVCQRLVPRDDGQGRVVALEVMFNVPAIGNLIREDKIYQIPNMMKVNRNSGNICLEESIQKLMEKKVVNSTEAYYVVNDYLIFEKGGTQESLETKNGQN